MRGEKHAYRVYVTDALGSPPRARGKAPACRHRGRWCRDHPRVRGEKRPQHRPVLAHVGSPPRARGKVLRHTGKENLRGITPACAGKRPRPKRDPGACWDHPRVRGEKRCDLCDTVTVQGSPPRARGKAGVFALFVDVAGITPACAGKRLAWEERR